MKLSANAARGKLRLAISYPNPHKLLNKHSLGDYGDRSLDSRFKGEVILLETS